LHGSRPAGAPRRARADSGRRLSDRARREDHPDRRLRVPERARVLEGGTRVLHRPRGHLGVLGRRRATRHHPDPGSSRQPRLRRARPPDALLHRADFRLCDARQDARPAASLVPDEAMKPLRALVVLSGLVGTLLGIESGGADPGRRPVTPDERSGSFFGPAPTTAADAAPPARELKLPAFADATAIWGSTGRDLQGRIWIGVSANSPRMSAHLMQYDPEADVMHDRGAVVDQLKTAGLHRAGEGQIKIHSRIVTAEDGWIYFASTDEDGEREDGTVPPRWGGHFWRLDPDSGKWEHLWAAPEGLVAASGVGRYVFVLGYWNHVLFQYDTTTGKTKRAVVGSVGGHVSRNFLADGNGHAYVPRLTRSPQGKVTVALVEYDADLQELAASPLEYYAGKGVI